MCLNSLFIFVFAAQSLLAMDPPPETPKNEFPSFLLTNPQDKEILEFYEKAVKFEVFNYPVIFLEDTLEESMPGDSCVFVDNAYLYKDAVKHNWLPVYVFIHFFYQNQKKLKLELRRPNSTIIAALKTYKDELKDHIDTCTPAKKDEQVNCCQSHSFDQALKTMDAAGLVNSSTEIMKSFLKNHFRKIDQELAKVVSSTQGNTCGYSTCILDLIKDDKKIKSQNPTKSPPFGTVAGKHGFEQIYLHQYNYINCLDASCLADGYLPKDPCEVSHPIDYNIYIAHFTDPQDNKNSLYQLLKGLFEGKSRENQKTWYDDEFKKHFIKFCKNMYKNLARIPPPNEKIDFLKNHKQSFDLYLKYLFSYASVNTCLWLKMEENANIYSFLYDGEKQGQSKKAKNCILF